VPQLAVVSDAYAERIGIAVEVGMLSFEGAFLGQIMLPTGETVLERIERDKKLLSLPPPSAAH